MLGEAENAPPSILYSTLKPVTAVTVGKINADAHVPAGSVIVGAVGNITTLTVLLTPHEPGPAVLVVVLPQAAVRKYSATTVWQPGVFGMVGEAENAPPFILY